MEQPSTVSGAPSAATPAAPASAPLSGQAALDSMTSAERQSWELTGDIPERLGITTPPASSAAAPEDQAAATAATPPPASEPGTPATPRKGAAARKAELDAEVTALQETLRLRKALREELASLNRSQDGKPGAPTSAAPPTTPREWDGSDPRDPKPVDADFESYNEFLDARDAWNERRFERKAEAKQYASAQQAELAHKGSEAMARVQTYAAANPGFTDRVDPRLIAIPLASAMPPDAVRPPNVLAEAVIDSPATGQLLDHFSTPEGQKDWQRLCAQPTRSGMLRELGRIEARMEAPAPASAPAAPAPKTLSSAPPPATTVGSRPTEPIDPAEAALKRKDFTAFAAAENARELAARG